MLRPDPRNIVLSTSASLGDIDPALRQWLQTNFALIAALLPFHVAGSPEGVQVAFADQLAIDTVAHDLYIYTGVDGQNTGWRKFTRAP